MDTRHVFYQLVGPPYNLVPKDQNRGYRPIQRKMLDMRRASDLPWEWVSDGTRWRRQRLTFDSAAEAVRHIAETYRRDLWRRTPVYCEIWCESDSMAGVIVGETDRYGVSLMVSRGFSSDSYLYAAANDIKQENRPAHLYYVGDWDPSGKIIPEVRDILRGDLDLAVTATRHRAGCPGENDGPVGRWYGPGHGYRRDLRFAGRAITRARWHDER